MVVRSSHSAKHGSRASKTYAERRKYTKKPGGRRRQGRKGGKSKRPLCCPKCRTGQFATYTDQACADGLRTRVDCQQCGGFIKWLSRKESKARIATPRADEPQTAGDCAGPATQPVPHSAAQGEVS